MHAQLMSIGLNQDQASSLIGKCDAGFLKSLLDLVETYGPIAGGAITAATPYIAKGDWPGALSAVMQYFLNHSGLASAVKQSQKKAEAVKEEEAAEEAPAETPNAPTEGTWSGGKKGKK